MDAPTASDSTEGTLRIAASNLIQTDRTPYPKLAARDGAPILTAVICPVHERKDAGRSHFGGAWDLSAGKCRTAITVRSTKPAFGSATFPRTQVRAPQSENCRVGVRGTRAGRI
jgi:hypothetical protein